ncbi:Uncharacterised protein, partial [Mycoplasma putrefaciens]
MKNDLNSNPDFNNFDTLKIDLRKQTKERRW